jgi:O-antigen ligase
MILVSVVFAVTIAFALAICVVFWATLTKPRFGLWILVFSMLGTAVLTVRPALYFGFNFYLLDLVLVIVGGAAVSRMLFAKERVHVDLCWLAYGALLLLSFARGALVYRIGAANAFREFYYFWAVAAYFSTFRYSEDDIWRLLRIWLWATVALVALAIFRWICDALGLELAVMWRGIGDFVPFRVLISHNAMIMASSMVILSYMLINRMGASYWKMLLILVCGLCVIVLQHRSVWVATIAGAVLLFMLESKNRARVSGQLALLGIGIGVATAVLFAAGYGERIMAQLGASVEEATHAQHSTFTWRIQSWRELTSDLIQSGPAAVAFGKPMGTAWDRILEAVENTVSAAPHNFYIQILTRAGVLGLVFFVATYALQLRRLLSAYAAGTALRLVPMLIVLLGMQLVYFVPYSGDYVAAMLLGVSMSFTNQLRSADPAWPMRVAAAEIR